MKYQIPHHAAFKVVQHCRLAAVKADLLQVLSHDQNINEDQIWPDMILTTCTQLFLCYAVSISRRKYQPICLMYLFLPLTPGS